MDKVRKTEGERSVFLAVTAEKVIGTVELSVSGRGSPLQMAMYLIAEDIEKTPAEHYEPVTYYFPSETGGRFKFEISHIPPIEIDRAEGHKVTVA